MSANGVALVLIDPLNEFLEPKGKLYPLVQESLTATNTVENLHKLVRGAREANIPIYYGLHQSYQDGFYAGWKHMRPNHKRGLQSQTFAGWGGQVVESLNPSLSNGDVVVSRHWNSSSFKNTDLDYQLRQREITHLVMAGMVANTCLESTAREATELGYTVTLIKDGTAGFSTTLKDAATDIVWPTIVDEVLDVQGWLESLKAKSEVKI